MFIVSRVLPLLMLLTVLASNSFATDIIHEELEPAATFLRNSFEKGDNEDSYATHKYKYGDNEEDNYKDYHKDETVEKEHHELDKDYGYYDEDDGGGHHNRCNDGYYDEYHYGEGGKKERKFGEEGNYGKGYKTHGEHEVKRFDEYEKTTEYRDNDYGSNFDKYNKGNHRDHDDGKGSYYKGNYHDLFEHKDNHAKGDSYKFGHHDRDHKGYKSDINRNDHHSDNYRQGMKMSHDDNDIWNHHKEY